MIRSPVALRHTAVIPLAAAMGLVASIPLTFKLAEAVPAPGTEIMPVSAIKTGMKGYGLTVFQGTEPERFDVEVLGVVHQFRPHQDLVLIKTLHPRLEVAKVVAGMSGSPVYIDGKMIGAYAYGWQFGAEPIAGVTPIHSMLAEMARPLPVTQPIPLPAANKSERPQASLGPDGTKFAGGAGTYDLRQHARQLASLTGAPETGGPRLTQVSTPVLLGGLGDGAAKLARELLEPLGLEAVQGGGAGNRVEADAPTRFVDGGAIGVQMISGDISAMGLGTVTRVNGEKLVAFGHPMMNAGVSSMPTSIGKVLWVLASQMRSFKIGEGVRPLGALVNDRQAAIVVDSKGVAPSFPATVEIEGVEAAPHKNWSFTIAHEKFMTPAFLAVAVGNAIDSTTSERRDVSWHAMTEVKIAGYAPIRLEDAGVAVGGTPDADDWTHSRAVRAVGALLNNPWQPVRIEKIATKIAIRFTRDSLRLRGAEALADEVDAGQPARIRLHLEPYAGPAEQKIIEVPIPPELAGRDVDIEIEPGYREAPELPNPERLTDLLANLPRQSFAPDSIVASIKLPEQGVSLHGLVAERLPRGALDALRPLHDSASPEPFASYVRTSIPLHRLLDGRDRVRVRVRPVLR